jgi:hypothetical protein
LSRESGDVSGEDRWEESESVVDLFSGIRTNDKGGHGQERAGGSRRWWWWWQRDSFSKGEYWAIFLRVLGHGVAEVASVDDVVGADRGGGDWDVSGEDRCEDGFENMVSNMDFVVGRQDWSDLQNATMVYFAEGCRVEPATPGWQWKVWCGDVTRAASGMEFGRDGTHRWAMADCWEKENSDCRWLGEKEDEKTVLTAPKACKEVDHKRVPARDA